MCEEQKKKVIENYINGIYTEEEAAEFLSSVRDPACDRMIAEAADAVWQEASGGNETEEERRNAEQEASVLLGRIRRKKMGGRFRTVAAVSAAAVMLAFFMLFHPFPWREDGEPSYARAAAGFGEKRQVTLPDGSYVMLNSCSEIRYPAVFSGKIRNVELEGEAYFDIVRDDKRSFVIKTNGFDVRVLGTSFNVKSYEGDELSMVNVERGLVQVDMPEAMFRLHADEKLVVNKNSGSVEKHPDSYETSLWRKGQLHFDATPIRDVAKVLEREYNCHISFQEGQRFDNLISGQHDNRSLNAVLESIGFVSGVSFKREGNHILFYKQ